MRSITCDRCGKVIKLGATSMDSSADMVVFGYFRGSSKGIDLCSGCKDSFVEWINELGMGPTFEFKEKEEEPQPKSPYTRRNSHRKT